jgi:hypothetical protein
MFTKPYEDPLAVGIDISHERNLDTPFFHILLVDANGAHPQAALLFFITQTTKSRFKVTADDMG